MKTLTEEAFAHTLKDIMQEKSFDKVTVTELVQRMHVNRQTFYYHFNDLYDLLEKIYISDGEQMIGDNRTDDSWEKGMLAIFQYILANQGNAFLAPLWIKCRRHEDWERSYFNKKGHYARQGRSSYQKVKELIRRFRKDLHNCS